MVTDTPHSPPTFFSAKRVRARYGIADMTLWRWLHSPEINFPRPIYLGRQRYWRLTDLEAWEAAAEARAREAATAEDAA